ncbi:MAG: hypothetical protein IT517_19505 [Burkholderiales bacterium]|nr:hypothetical protein [Burkholderiales bacterium]
MTRSHAPLTRWWIVASALLLAALSTPSSADPPARAARLSYVSANASFSPAGSDEWLQARINRPLWIGDRVWTGEGRAELQIGGASLRLAPRTLLRVLNFDNRIAQFELAEGTVALHVRLLDRDDTIEIDTPTLAFVVRDEGDYRLDVELDRTAVGVRRGEADVYGTSVAYRIDQREQFVFYDPDLRDYDVGPLERRDAFDRWARERASREDASVSARYVSPELVGYADLDAYGDWRVDATYGNVWIPRVAADWAPYRYGHWSWVDPWGWTWIADAPWGFASAHYGRWARIGGTWAWVPGPRDVRPVYAPALVAWVGGDDFSLSVSAGRTRGVAWFPLAPGEVWRPPYDVSREYFTRVNVTNTFVDQTQVINIYESRGARRDRDYRYRNAVAAVTAVPVETLVRGRPVQQNVVQVNNNVIVNAPVVAAAPAQPTVQSFVGAAPRSQARPPAEAVRKPVIARTAPPAAAVPTPQDRMAIVQSQGRPVDRATLERIAQPQQQPRQQGAPAPGALPVLPPTQAPAGQAEAGRVAPNQLRANVRVVEPQAAPKPPPPSQAGGGDQRRQPRAASPAEQPQAPGAPQAQSPPPAAGGAARAPAETRARGSVQEDAPRAPSAAMPPGQGNRAPAGPAKDAERQTPPGQAGRAPAAQGSDAERGTPPARVDRAPAARERDAERAAGRRSPAAGAPSSGAAADDADRPAARNAPASPARGPSAAPAAPVAPAIAPRSDEDAAPARERGARRAPVEAAPQGATPRGPAAAEGNASPPAARESPARPTPTQSGPARGTPDESRAQPSRPPQAAAPAARAPVEDTRRAPAPDASPPRGPEGPRAAKPQGARPDASAAPAGAERRTPPAAKGESRRGDDDEDAPGKGKGRDRDERGNKG